jgi:hypothetical protein
VDEEKPHGQKQIGGVMGRKPLFTDAQLIELYNSPEKPSLYRITQILGVSPATVKARAKKLGLKPRPLKKSKVVRSGHTILAYQKTIKQVDRLAKKLGIPKSHVWEMAVNELYDSKLGKI